MFADFIIKHSAPIIENKIREIIEKVALKHRIDATQLDCMLKDVYDQLEIFVFYQNKKIDRFPMSDITITGTIVDHIHGMFRRDGLVYNVNPGFVNYVFKIFQGQGLMVNPNIAGEYKGWLHVKEIL